jgi:hypothetical protein
MSKPIYKPQRPYSEDINDLVEKGGPGSGKKGHVTYKPNQPSTRVPKEEPETPVKTPKALSNSDKVDKLNDLKDEFEADGQKHAMKVVDKKIKELSAESNLDTQMTETFTESEWPDSRLASLVSDLTMEDGEDINVNDMDRSDMLSEISSKVSQGIKGGDWTFDEWYSDIKDTY